MLFVIDFELYITGIEKAARFSIYAALTNYFKWLCVAIQSM